MKKHYKKNKKYFKIKLNRIINIKYKSFKTLKNLDKKYNLIKI
jgi:hypothetical protein